MGSLEGFKQQSDIKPGVLEAYSSCGVQTDEKRREIQLNGCWTNALGSDSLFSHLINYNSM